MNTTRPNRPRRFDVVRGVILSALLSLTPHLLAQSQTGPANDAEGWRFTVAPYLMTPWMDGTSAVRGHEVEVNLTPSDIFKNFQFGVMGYFEARKGKWGVGADAMYMALGTTVERVPILGNRANADVDFNQGAYTFVGVRELNGSADLLFGARWNVLHSRIGFKGPQQSVFEGTKQWVDPLVGLNLKKRLGGRWSFNIEGDIGGFGAGSDFAWSVFPLVGVDVGKRATLKAGYRVLGSDYSTGGGDTLFKYDVVTQGLVLGVVLHR